MESIGLLLNANDILYGILGKGEKVSTLLALKKMAETAIFSSQTFIQLSRPTGRTSGLMFGELER